jgi:hypothetical protein
MSAITDALLARGWAFDAEGVLSPPEPSPPLSIGEIDGIGARWTLPAHGELVEEVIRGVDGQILSVRWVRT